MTGPAAGREAHGGERDDGGEGSLLSGGGAGRHAVAFLGWVTRGGAPLSDTEAGYTRQALASRPRLRASGLLGVLAGREQDLHLTVATPDLEMG